MSTIFRFGVLPFEKSHVIADSGCECVALGRIDDEGRLVFCDDGSCSSVAVSPDELERLAAFVRRHGKQQPVDDVPKLVLELTERERCLLRGVLHFTLLEAERVHKGTEARERLARETVALCQRVYVALLPAAGGKEDAR